MELIVRNVAKAYGDHQALRWLSLSAGPGVTALLGPNGSGKSTLLRTLATVSQPDTGTIAFCGRSYAGDQRPLRRVIGYLPQDLELPGHMTPRTLLRYVARLKQVRDDTQSRELLARIGLEDVANRRLDALSGGQIRRVGIAQTLLGTPRLLLLDEPLAGLDPEERRNVVRLLHRYATDRVVLLSTHVPGDVEALARRVIVLHRGTALLDADIDTLRERAAGLAYEIIVAASETEDIMQRYLVSRVNRQGDHNILRVVGELPPGARGALVTPSLEDAYLLLQHEQRIGHEPSRVAHS
jgi:ABC-2 type transport system ATP-binding protein